MEDIIASFADEVRSGRVEIYNEFSLQHEFGIFLRTLLSDRKVQFERNVSYFGLNKDDFEKREIDIVVFDEENPRDPEIAIELKFPRNGQYPETMFSICKDIAFTEQLKRSCFANAYAVIFADDHNFYDGKPEGIYGYFRDGKTLTGIITKPTGKRDTFVTICGSYSIQWHSVTGTLRYALVEASPSRQPNLSRF